MKNQNPYCRWNCISFISHLAIQNLRTKIFDSKGKLSDYDAMIAAAKNADIVFLW